MTPELARIRTATEAEVPGLRWDVSACRPVAGTNPPVWSQHSYDNAADLWGSAADLERAYRFLAGNKARLGVDELCYRGRGGCTTPHNDHVHVSAHPKRRGTPPCAGGTSRPPAAGGGVTTTPTTPVVWDTLIPGWTGIPWLLDRINPDSETSLRAVGSGLVIVLSWITRPENWRRIGLVAAGLLLLLVGVLLVLKDTAAGDVIGATVGGAVGGPAGAAVGSSIV